MRKEARDWCIYRTITDRNVKTIADVIECTHFDSSIDESSIQRLIEAGLIFQHENLLCITPFQGTIVHCRMREDSNSPICMDDGVIRVKKDRKT